ncbi:MAG: hypothetical protein RLY93_12505 [Sumerlaeia bacterium]
MKFLLTVLTAVLLTSRPVFGDGVRLHSSDSVHSNVFPGEIIDDVVHVVNETDQAVTLVSIQISCQCSTSTQNLPAVIEPGTSLEIPLVIDTTGRRGSFGTGAFLRFADSLELHYGVQVGLVQLFHPPFLWFHMTDGEFREASKSTILTLPRELDVDHKRFQIQAAARQKEGFRVEFMDVGLARDSRQYEVTVTPDFMPESKTQTAITIPLTGEQEAVLPIGFKSADKFDIDPDTLSFGTIIKGDKSEKRSVRVEAVDTSQAVIVSKTSFPFGTFGNFLPSTSGAVINVTLDSSHVSPGSYHDLLTVEFTTGETLEIPVEAFVVRTRSDTK